MFKYGKTTTAWSIETAVESIIHSNFGKTLQ